MVIVMIDSHAHVATPQFDGEHKAVLLRAQHAGVEGWIEVGTDIAQSAKAVALAAKLPGVWATVGVHPSDISELTDKGWEKIATLLSQPRVVAVGEVGFDYFRGGTHKAQEEALRRFISLANERNLPVVFHVRNGPANAHDDLLHVLESLTLVAGGVIHTFSGTWPQAERYLALGLHLSFSGVVTFKNGQEIAAVAQKIPLDRLLIETDCPYLAPEPYRGKRNEPAYAALIAERIAGLRGQPLASIQLATQEATVRLFRLAL